MTRYIAGACLVFLCVSFCCGNAMAAEEIDVLKAKTEMLSYLTSETCTIDDELKTTLDLSVGDQFLLIVKSDTDKYGLVTIDRDYEDGSDNNDIRMRSSGSERFDQTTPFDAYADGDWAPVHGETDSWLSTNDELGEFLEETSSSQADMLVLAPHGGAIEAYTDEQAQWVYDELDALGDDASAWYCIGYQSEIGAHNAWHITSTDLSENSFPYLKDVSNRTYSYAVSFHGCESCTDVYIGGGASSILKNEVKDAIDNIPGFPYSVTVVSTGSYAGTDSDNIVNRYSNNGVQIEQPYGARSGYWDKIADAVVDVFAPKIEGKKRCHGKRSIRKCKKRTAPK